MSELKRCPFCGGEAILESDIVGKGKELWYVSCKSDCVTQYGYSTTKERAIEKWNTRKPVERVIEQIQELANEFQEGYYHEVHCKNREDNCEGKDCCACVLERAIEIIKEELM